MRDLHEQDGHKVPWDAEAWNDRSITNNGEGEKVHEQDGRDLPRDAPKTWNNHSIPSRIVTQQIPSARAITRSENLALPSHTTQEDTATSADKGLLPEMETSRRGRSKPVVKKNDESLIPTEKRKTCSLCSSMLATRKVSVS